MMSVSSAAGGSRDKPPLLMLCHRVPYPPDKGDKIRSYNLLIHLLRTYSVHLGAFVDDPADLEHVNELSYLCESLNLVSINTKLAKLASLRGIFGHQPLTCLVYSSFAMQGWVDNLVAKNNSMPVVAFSSVMAQFLVNNESHKGSKLVDFVDVDSDKWRQFSKKSRGPAAWIYKRESKTLQEFENKVCAYSDRSYFVSSSEAELFAKLNSQFASKIDYFKNGVDFDFFDRAHDFQNPYEKGCKAIVFTGAMDYWPNVDAVMWFSHNVLPSLTLLDDKWHFFVVGSKPTNAVLSLANHKSITVTGRVDDIRPFLHHACVSVAPMRIARGIQNKVLEAMAMQLPVFVSDKGLEGINANDKEHLMVANSSNDYVDGIYNLTSEVANNLGLAARELIVQEFKWSTCLRRIDLAFQSASMTGKLP